jgi:hypothetical protein
VTDTADLAPTQGKPPCMTCIFDNQYIYIYIPTSPTSVGSRSALLRFIGSVGNLSLLTPGNYYSHKSKMKWWKGNGDRTGMWYGYWSVQQVMSHGHGHSLVALFSLFVSIKDRSLHGPWSSHRLIIPSTYLLMRAGKLVTLLSWAPALSGQTDW